MVRDTVGVVVGVLLLVGSAAAAFQSEDPSSPKLRIAWEDFKKLHDSNEAIVVDVRGADAFEAGHIPGARSIPLDMVAQHAAELKKLKKPVVLYCA